MKISLLLSAASVATAFVVPDETILSVFADENGIQQQRPLSPQRYDNTLDASVGPFSSVADGLIRYLREVDIAASSKGDGMRKGKHGCQKKGHHHVDAGAYGFEEDHPHDHGFLGGIKKGWKHLFDRPHDDDEDEDGHEDGHHPHHGGHEHHAPNKTIYELISGYEHAKVFTHVINQYDEVVQYLNSTKANYTVFVPLDHAFRHWDKDHHFPQDVVLKWLQYHVSPNVYPRKSFFNVQTVPTYLKEENESGNPQRISTQVGLRGLTLNFHPRVLKPNIFATNGVIHALDEILILPLPAQKTIELVPSVFSTLNLGLIRTGLIDKLDRKVPITGGTVFAPTNLAFAKLGPHVNAFLFSDYGRKYLKALLKYHVVANHTLFSDAYYEPKEGGDGVTELVDGHHINLPTLLHEKSLSVDIRHFHRFSRIIVNGHVTVAVPNVPVQEGVIHLVSTVLIPPHEHRKEEESFPQVFAGAGGDGRDHDEMVTVEDLIERLEPYV